MSESRPAPPAPAVCSVPPPRAPQWSSIRSAFAAFLLAVGVLPSGCQQLLRNPFHKETETRVTDADEKHPVTEIVCLWEPAEGTGLDGLPCRGFAGQILYFTRQEDAPIRSEGDVRIYVFDDHSAEEAQTRPLHEFNFDSGSFQHFYSETNLGGAYRLFIPYTRAGMHQANCSLRVRLTPPYGRPVYSKMATVVLAGAQTEKSLGKGAFVAESRGGVERASFSAPAADLKKPSGTIAAPELSDLRLTEGISLGEPPLDRGAVRNQLRSRLSELAAQPNLGTVPAVHEEPAAEEPSPYVLQPRRESAPAASLDDHPLLQP